MAYGVVHTSNLSGCDTYSFVHPDKDVENGSFVFRKDLMEGEREIYECDAPGTEGFEDAPVYLVAHPAWSYDDSRTLNQNEENFINKKGRPFRVYKLRQGKRYRVSVDMLEGPKAAEAGMYVGLSLGGFKGSLYSSAPSGGTFRGKILSIDTIGHNYNVGSPGTIGNTQKFALIEVLYVGGSPWSA